MVSMDVVESRHAESAVIRHTDCVRVVGTDFGITRVFGTVDRWVGQRAINHVWWSSLCWKYFNK